MTCFQIVPMRVANLGVLELLIDIVHLGATVLTDKGSLDQLGSDFTCTGDRSGNGHQFSESAHPEVANTLI